MTHINDAFANIRDGRVVEGFTHDTENFKVLAGVRRSNPHLKVVHVEPVEIVPPHEVHGAFHEPLAPLGCQHRIPTR